MKKQIVIISLISTCACVQAQNLFVSDYGSDNIIEFTPSGVQSTFASGLSYPQGLAFNSAGNLFVSEQGGNIYEFTTGGARSIFASGLNNPVGLAFNSAGNLFVANYADGNIIEFTPSGAQSTFASGLSLPYGLAFNSAGDLFDTDDGFSGIPSYIYEFTPDGVESTFASGFDYITGLAFQPVPEPSALGLLAVGVTALLVHRRRCATATLRQR